MSVLALDIGSSRVKALLAHWDGRLIEVRSARTPRQTVDPGEQAYPAEAVLTTIERLVSGLMAAHREDPADTLVFSCLGTAMVPLDRAEQPLGAALAPADTRPTRGPWLDESVDMPADELFGRTGSDPGAASSLLHFLWWQREHPGVLERLHRFRSLRGYAVAEFCGADAEDHSWASRTMLVDLETNAWSEAILAAAGLPAEALPPIEPPTATYPIGDSVVQRLGLARGAVAVLGGMDNCCAVFGSAGPDGAGLVNIVGTFEHMARAASLQPARQVASAADAIIHTYLLPGQYITMTRVPMGDLLSRAAAGYPGGLERLLDEASPEPLERTMRLDGDAVDGALTAGVPRSSVLQALLEASAAVLKRFADAWADPGLASSPVTAVGGGAAHDAVLQLKANLLGRPFVRLASDEAASLGALRLAAMAVRDLPASEACDLFTNPTIQTYRPRIGRFATEILQGVADT
ncbi:MAG: FGGY family carbohydrate kinase [Chloroflexota bacterium]